MSNLYDETNAVTSDSIEAASADKVLEFCNDVRDAGGGNPLDSLLPGKPTDASQCLIARNLNFSCRVGYEGDDYQVDSWYMTTDEGSVGERIWFALKDKWNLSPFERFAYDTNGDPIYNDFDEPVKRIVGFWLPPDIAKVAYEFDAWEISKIVEGGVPDAWGEYITPDYKDQINNELGSYYHNDDREPSTIETWNEDREERY